MVIDIIGGANEDRTRDLLTASQAEQHFPMFPQISRNMIIPFIHTGFVKLYISSCFLKFPCVILLLVAIRLLETF